MGVKVKINRASTRFDEQLIRHVCGSPVRTDKLIREFAKGPVVGLIRRDMTKALNDLHSALMWVFSGGVLLGGPIKTLSTPQGPVRLRQSWQPLAPVTLEEKKSPSFWRETGDLQVYIAQQLSALAGPGAVRKVEVKAGKVQRGAKTVRASVLVTPVRLPEPLQTLVMYPFLQGEWVRLSAAGTDGNEAKLLANSLLRGFMPDIATEFGLRALDSIRSS